MISKQAFPPQQPNQASALLISFPLYGWGSQGLARWRNVPPTKQWDWTLAPEPWLWSLAVWGVCALEGPERASWFPSLIIALSMGKSVTVLTATLTDCKMSASHFKGLQGSSFPKQGIQGTHQEVWPVWQTILNSFLAGWVAAGYLVTPALEDF